MNRSEFVELVVAEVENVKLNATAEEKEKLNRETFIHYSGGGCLYGQLTGFSFSGRAKELTPKTFENITRQGKMFDADFEDLDFQHGGWFTALEKYLYIITQEERLHILDYIKGDVETLTLN
jgi:hypothetical protein